MLDHVTIGVSNLTRARKFYDDALKPLGIERLYALVPDVHVFFRVAVKLSVGKRTKYGYPHSVSAYVICHAFYQLDAVAPVPVGGFNFCVLSS